MKAKIKATGEIVDVEFEETKDLYHKVELFKTSDGRIMPITAFEFEKFIDWEQRRWDAALAAMQGLLLDPAINPDVQTVAKASLEYADALIEELKKGGGNE